VKSALCAAVKCELQAKELKNWMKKTNEEFAEIDKHKLSVRYWNK